MSALRGLRIPILTAARQVAVAPRISLALPAIRSFHLSPIRLSIEGWSSKGAVSYSELKPETSSPSGNITIIDVREPNEVEQGMIPSAVNVPLSQFQTAFSGDGGDFVRNFAFNRPGYDDKIIVYCRSGKRSDQAKVFAQKQGWNNVRNYEGSWLDWVQQEESNNKNN